jgi:hypothetical protein
METTTAQVFNGVIKNEKNDGNIVPFVITTSYNEDSLTLDIAKTLFVNTAFDQTTMSVENIVELCIKRAKIFVKQAKNKKLL